MRIAVGSDHAGYELKNQLVQYLQHLGNEVHDMGTFNKESVDYPDYALLVGQTINREQAEMGVLICYTGIGMSMAANKIKGIRAALVSSVENAKLTREHNDANVLCLGAKDTPYETAVAIVDTFLQTKFTEGRHLRRVCKVMQIEKNEKK